MIYEQNMDDSKDLYFVPPNDVLLITLIMQ